MSRAIVGRIAGISAIVAVVAVKMSGASLAEIATAAESNNGIYQTQTGLTARLWSCLFNLSVIY